MPAQPIIEPGIYIANRRIGQGPGQFKLPYWVHQFLVMVPKDPSKFPPGTLKNFRGAKAILISGNNVESAEGDDRVLGTYQNNPREVSAFREFVNTVRGKQAEPYFEPKVGRNLVAGQDVDTYIQKALQAHQAFVEHTKAEPVKYPKLLPNMMGRAPNSNTLVNSLVDASGLQHSPEDYTEGAIGQDLRFPKEYFMPKAANAAEYLDVLFKIAARASKGTGGEEGMTPKDKLQALREVPEEALKERFDVTPNIKGLQDMYSSDVNVKPLRRALIAGALAGGAGTIFGGAMTSFLSPEGPMTETLPGGGTQAATKRMRNAIVVGGLFAGALAGIPTAMMVYRGQSASADIARQKQEIMRQKLLQYKANRYGM